MDFNFEEKASDSKKRLEEAKARLIEEKRRFKEEMRAAKSHGISHGEPILKPWMIWDISLFVVMIILFSIAMYYPRTGVELTGAAVAANQTTTQTPSTTGSAILVVENISNGVTQSSSTTAAQDEIEGPPPRFSLIIEDKEGN